MERILIKFTKENNIKFISHLDTMRLFKRAMKRAGILVEYSKGFNPHPGISISAPLSLGIESISEYADVELNQIIDENIIINKLSLNLPIGVTIKSANRIDDKKPSSMSIVAASDYLIKMKCKDIDSEEIKNIFFLLLEEKEILINKKTKSGEKIANIREQIKLLSLDSIDDNWIFFKCTIDTGSKSNLNPDVLCRAIENFSHGKIYGYAYIKRVELYAYADNMLIPIDKYLCGE